MNDEPSTDSAGRGQRAGLALLRILTALMIVTAIGACGGGGGGDGGGGGGNGTVNDWVSGVFVPASTFQGMCAAPRPGSEDIQGSSSDEKHYLRSFSNNTYLWYDEILDQDPALFSTPGYFDELVTLAQTPSGNDKDRFHFALSTEEWIALSQSGATAGYGAQFALLQSIPPRRILVAYSDPLSPAMIQGGLKRGTEILVADGIDVINGNDTDTLNAALFPSEAGQLHTFTVRDLGSLQTRTFSMISEIVTSVPVQTFDLISTASGDVGYVLFNDHIATAERGLFDEVTRLQAAGITDLVIDLRYNGGGFLDIASEFAYMIAGAMPTAGRTFELLSFNDKHPATNPITGQAITPVGFHTQGVGFDPSLTGTPLPTLDLARVFVLTGPGTCSASESIMNSLRGVGVEVIQIGSTTCGKPYGFYAQDNCGTSYFTIQFRGENELGFGDYADGFSPANTSSNVGTIVPGCSVGDDFTAELGDPVELRLAAALNYIETGACPSPSGVVLSQQAKTRVSDDTNMLIPKSAFLKNRIVRR